MLFQDVFVNLADDFKSFLSASCYDEIMRTEGVFSYTITPNNPEDGNWIALHVKNQPIDELSKILLLLKMYLAHWLNIESSKNTHRPHTSMKERENGLGHGSLTTYFPSDKKCAKNCIETHSCFNQLLFHSFEGLVPEILSSYDEFSANFNFLINSFSHSIH